MPGPLMQTMHTPTPSYGTGNTIPAAQGSDSHADSGNQSSAYAGAAMSAIDQILAKNQEALNKAAMEASTPVAGNVPTAIPSNLQGRQRVPQVGELDHREVVGAGNARAQGIGNSVIGVMNAVNRISAAHENKKSLEIADATQQLMELQQGINEAKLVTPEQGAETYATAQKVIQANTQRQQTILSDNTIRKAIQKGMKIDFTDPKENNTPEHKGVLWGRRKAEEAEKQRQLQKDPLAYAKKFQEGQPKGMVPNTPAIQRYQMLAEQQKNLVNMQRAMAPVLSAAIRAGAYLKGKEIGEIATNARKQADIESRWKMNQTNIEARKDLLGMRYSYTLRLQGNAMRDRVEEAKEIFDYKEGSTYGMQKKFDAFVKNIDQDIDRSSTLLNTLLAGRDVAAKQKVDSKELDLYNQMIQQQQAILADATAHKNQVKETFDTFKKIANLGGSANVPGNGEPDSSGSGQSSGNSNVDPNSILFWGSDDAERVIESSNESEGDTPN